MLEHFEKFAEHLENELKRHEENTTNPQVAQLDQIGAAIRAAVTRKHLKTYQGILNTLPKAEMHSDGKAAPYDGINAGTEQTDWPVMSRISEQDATATASFQKSRVYIIWHRGMFDPESPAFIEAKKQLESNWFLVTNPDGPAKPGGFTREEWFEERRVAARCITYANHVVLLDGWERSRWERLAVEMALELGIPVTPIAGFLKSGGNK